MFRGRRQFLRAAVAAVAAPFFRQPAIALDYPARPVRLIVSVAPGGPTDVFARLAGTKLSEIFGKQFYVENIPGAGGNIAFDRAARSTPDGHTLLVAPSSYVVNPSLYPSVPYDPYKDFEPITIAANNVVALTVHPSLPVRTVDDLIAFAKANPGRLSYASAGTGQASHLVGETFRLMLGLDLVHVPFNGSGPAITSVIAGHTPIAFTSAATAAPQVNEGKLRALAIVSKTRLPALPEVPTMIEAGHPDVECDDWIAFLAPAGTPSEIVALLHREIVNIIALPEIKQRLMTLGFQPVGNTPGEFGAQIRSDLVKRAKLIRRVGIRMQ
jgi:tripartite-type tricarboxylate transporter receptor subunit TctC